MIKSSTSSIIIQTGLAIFAMLFGSGNLIYPPAVGIISKDQTLIGILAFLLSGILIPLAGLFGMILFKGDYKVFFHRVGENVGSFIVFLCILIIGPFLAMPRTVDTAYELIKPFINDSIGLFTFSILFIIPSFALCYKKSSILDIIGKILSPLILITLFIMVVIGIITGTLPAASTMSIKQVFIKNFLLGYNTLDLLGALFFGYIIVSILQNQLKTESLSDNKKLMKIILSSSIIGGSLLGLVYIGLAVIGALHGQGLENINYGEQFVICMQRVLGSYGTLFVSVSVILACLTTIVALGAVVTEYLHDNVANKKISYGNLAIIVFAITLLFSQLELHNILYYSEPFILILYPVMIMITLCNIAYKLFGFKYIKLPVLITLIIATYVYLPGVIKLVY